MKKETLMKNLLAVLPYWHYVIDRPFKQLHKGDMSLETYYCLQMLEKAGPMPMSELAKHMGCKKQQATRIISDLIKHDFVRRLSDEEDRRIVRIEITDKALNFIEEKFYLNSSFLREAKGTLTAGELEELNGSMETLLRLLPKLDNYTLG